MPDIFHEFPIQASCARVFDAISTPQGLDTWWTKSSAGIPERGAIYQLGFGPGVDWRAKVSRYAPGSEFELEIVAADSDWIGTLVQLTLDRHEDRTRVRFRHLHWPSMNEHYRISCTCWAAYLRILRRSLEYGESIPYENRLIV